MGKTEGLNVSIVAAASQLWLKNYAEDDKLEDVAFARHKKNLFGFFTDYCNAISDHKVHRLFGKVKEMLGEPWTDIKELKLKEIRALQTIDWQVKIESCELIEKALIELA